ncbi:hypothetical protein A2769_00900 [Candidatus Daviesbacteria bacterium RIFCSPHIGHO2_01_FULL_37_27]|nr:MAG: hypothetical protein A2769_00900 [Candidatus Daviesbacteria bacterium RIFCSPHIGHO2_01_FULL_37_27]
MIKTVYDNFQRFRLFKSKLQPWWSIIGAPVLQEPIFRYLPYFLLYLPTSRYWEVGILSSIPYAIVHFYFGKKIVVYTFFLGLFFWWIMVNFGLLVAILAHSFHNIFVAIVLGKKWFVK